MRIPFGEWWLWAREKGGGKGRNVPWRRKRPTGIGIKGIWGLRGVDGCRKKGEGAYTNGWSLRAGGETTAVEDGQTIWRVADAATDRK